MSDGVLATGRQNRFGVGPVKTFDRWQCAPAQTLRSDQAQPEHEAYLRPLPMRMTAQ